MCTKANVYDTLYQNDKMLKPMAILQKKNTAVFMARSVIPKYDLKCS